MPNLTARPPVLVLLFAMAAACGFNASGASGERDAGTGVDGGRAGEADAGGAGGPGGGDPDGGNGGGGGGGEGGDGCEGAVVCDDFEGAVAGGAPDPARWTVSSPNCSGAGSLAVDDAEAHSGSRSVRIDGAGGYCDHIFIASDAVAGIDGVVHGRFWVRLDSALGDSHVTFFAMRDATAAKDVRMGGQSRIVMWTRETDDATLPELSPTGIAQSVALTAGAWACVELAVDGAAGTIET